MPGRVELRLLAPARAADDGELQAAVEQPVRVDEHLRGSSAARASRRSARTAPPSSARSPSAAEHRRRCPAARRGRALASSRRACRRRRRAVNAELANTVSHVRARRGTCAECIEQRARRDPFADGAAARGRGSSSTRSPARCGGYIQSREVENVERAEQALERRAADAAPGLPPVVRERQQAAASARRGMPVERLGDPRAARAGSSARRRRSRGRPPRRLGEPGERAADVVADARPLVRERADVERDPHGR